MITGNFETGISGNTISASDPASANAWDGVVAGTTLAYDTAFAYDTVSLKVNTTSSVSSYVNWVAAFGTQTDHYGRVYVYFAMLPGASFQLVRWLSSGAQVCALLINTTGNLIVRDSGNLTVATSTMKIGIGQWTRIEWHVIHNTTTGLVEYKLFADPDSDIATEDVNTTSIATGASSGEVRFGVCSSAITTNAFWIDNIVENATAFPGSAILSNRLGSYAKNIRVGDGMSTGSGVIS